MNVNVNMGMNIKHKYITNVNTIDTIEYNLKIQREEYLKHANFYLGRY